MTSSADEDRSSGESLEDQPIELASEYAVVAAYIVSMDTIRFTVAGLYVAGVGLSAPSLLAADDLSRAIGSAVGVWLTVCVGMLEHRTWTLLHYAVVRGRLIERRYWKRTREGAGAGGFFLSMPGHDTRWRFITYTYALLLLYGGGALFWVGMLALSLG